MKDRSHCLMVLLITSHERPCGLGCYEMKVSFTRALRCAMSTAVHNEHSTYRQAGSEIL